MPERDGIPTYGGLTIVEVARMAAVINGPVLEEARRIRSEERAKRQARRSQVCLPLAGSAEPDQPGRVYFAECGDFIKIGYTLSVETRIASLSTGNPVPITLLLVVQANRDFERQMHDRFAEFRSRGEWFEKHPDLLSFIAELKAKRA